MPKARWLLTVLALAILVGGFLPGVTSGVSQEGTDASAVEQNPTEVVVVRLYFANRDELNAIAAEYDVWEVHHDQGYAVVFLTLAEYQALLRQGYRMEIDEEKTREARNPLGIPGYPCYRTVEETYQTLQDLATNYPSLAELEDIGDSWDKVTPGGPSGYDIYALRITNEAITPLDSKPTFFLMAEIHAREYTTAETATRFAEYLLQNYGTNPEITFLVDYSRVYVVPMTNPDGRKFAEQGQLWRKNTDNDDGCTTTYGTDLNRNHSYRWGCCGGSSGNPCAETYRGPSQASEPETQAIQNKVLSLFPDQRGPGDNDPAPANATGILITLHSYSELVLWPWGWTYSPSPNDAQLQTVGRKLAWYNNYTPQQSSDLYITDGTTDDWSYGELGIASFTFEMGTAFFQACTTFESTIWPNNRPALLYAFSVAQTPYLTAYGPDALNAAIAPNPVPRGTPATLTATINDTRRRYDPAQNIAAAEYFVLPLHGQTPPGDPGTGIPMSPQDGSWNSSIENVVATVDTASLEPGEYIIAIRGKDAGNNWGPFTAAFLTVEPEQCEPVHILSVTTDTLGCWVSFAADLSGTPPYSYEWDFGAVGSSSAPTPTVEFPASGTYPYTLTVSNCEPPVQDIYTGSVTLSCLPGCAPVQGATIAFAPPDPLVFQTVAFTGSVSAGDAPFTFTWGFGDGASGTGETTTHSYARAGLYTVVLTVTNCAGTASSIATQPVWISPYTIYLPVIVRNAD